MDYNSIAHDDIIAAFKKNVPDCYVRDYRDRGGYITVCRNYRTIKWGGQLSTTKEYRTIPAITLFNMPRGQVTAPSRFRGAALIRPGWKLEFRRAARHLTQDQMRGITKSLGRGEVFTGVK